jgi:hypothetical protein
MMHKQHDDTDSLVSWNKTHIKKPAQNFFSFFSTFLNFFGLHELVQVKKFCAGFLMHSLGVPYQEGEHICVETGSMNTKKGFALVESNDEFVRQTHKEANHQQENFLLPLQCIGITFHTIITFPTYRKSSSVLA